VPRGPSWDAPAQFDYVEDFVVANRQAGRLHGVVVAGRLVPIAEAVAAGLLVYLLAARLLGRLAGLFGAALWLTSPWVLGLGHLNGIDLPFTVSVLGAAIALSRHLARPTWARAAVVGACAGACLSVRFTGLVVAPLLVAGVGVARGPAGRRLGQCALAALLAYASVWIVVRAVAPAPPSGTSAALMGTYVEEGRGATPIARVALAVPWPAEYAAGIGYQARVAGERPVFLLGRAWWGRRWWYYPGALLVKVPLPVLLVGLAGAVRFFRSTRGPAAASVVALAGALGVFTVFQPGQAGLRYLMPVVALGLIPAAGVVTVASRPRWPAAFAAAAVVLLQVGAMWVAFPHSLAWTPPPFRPGYRFASDSNLDWGQDLGRLERWARGRSPYVAVFGPRGAAVAHSRPLRGTRPEQVRGWVAVSASALTTYGRGELAWLRKYCPVGDIGGTVLLYRFVAPPDPAPGPDVPPPPCGESAVSVRR
jgi:hypothetical protein